MKKLLLLLLALCVLLCACKKKPAETTAEQTTAEPLVTTEQITTEPVVTTEPIVTEVTLDFGDDVDVKYEVLTLADEELNAILDARSADILARYIPNISSIKELGGTAEYDVKLANVYKNEKILSAVFSGTYAIYYENSEEGGDVLYTVNIDPVSGKILETPDIVDYEKMVKAIESGRFDKAPDLSQYNPAYGIYPYVSIETTEDGEHLCLYVTESGMYETVLGYRISLDSASDFLRIQLTSEEN
ncbi:MAG: hypothetical protein IJN48_02965 [Clostridia bacterium]|nr:hypothetical protein [Clostridia bacterium]